MQMYQPAKCHCQRHFCMVSCERDSLTRSQRQPERSRRLVAWAAVALVSAICLVGVAMAGRETASAPEQVALMDMWNRPYLTTMLWNAAHDDDGSSDSDSYDDSSNDYTAFDTYGHGSDEGSKCVASLCCSALVDFGWFRAAQTDG